MILVVRDFSGCTIQVRILQHYTPQKQLRVQSGVGVAKIKVSANAVKGSMNLIGCADGCFLLVGG